MQDPAYKKMSRTKLLEILIMQPNVDAEKSVVIDVKSDDEIDETYDAIARENLPLKKRIFFGRTTTVVELTLSSKRSKDELIKVWSLEEGHPTRSKT